MPNVKQNADAKRPVERLVSQRLREIAEAQERVRDLEVALLLDLGWGRIEVPMDGDLEEEWRHPGTGRYMTRKYAIGSVASNSLMTWVAG